MKRTYSLLVATLAAILLAGLVYVVLRIAHVSEPAATTVHGPTLRRLWATMAAALGLAGAITASLALARPAGRPGASLGMFGAVVAGLIAAVNGGLVLAFATGGPGSGNGVVGGAGALVLGGIALALGGLAVARSRGIARRTPR